ncbi:CotD family spore coat protein [Neobacillus pocheonensis]|uniref:CotD family spore coat protein n=1 Tax=Neobacillus pocheonensis TaxID=363869 RepID=UPI003D2B798E
MTHHNNDVKTNIFNKVVTHVHPPQTTTVYKLHINHQHYFPHTESCVNECCETHTMSEYRLPHVVLKDHSDFNLLNLPFL